MSEKLTRFFASRWGIILAGAVIGLLAPLLQYAGNPKNMGICVACFERDIAGALGLHRASVVPVVGADPQAGKRVRSGGDVVRAVRLHVARVLIGEVEVDVAVDPVFLIGPDLGLGHQRFAKVVGMVRG